jgi:hypothetical protein
MNDIGLLEDDNGLRFVIADRVATLLDADPESVRLITVKRKGRFCGVALEFRGLPFPPEHSRLLGYPRSSGTELRAFCLITLAKGRRFHFSSFSANARSAEGSGTERSLSLHGSLVPVPFIGGILERNTAAHTVSVRDARGVTLDDTVRRGYVLFLSETALANPLTFTVRNAAGMPIEEIERSF